MGNQTVVTEFILLGLSSSPTTRLFLFGLFSAIYTITLAGNVTILLLIWLDSQLHTPMYFFLSHLSFVDICYTSSTWGWAFNSGVTSGGLSHGGDCPAFASCPTLGWVYMQ
uniref:G-protein coupled receptors family 1 profile domain-containing protein n=1 Tax=Sphenodon punctatus TaxID=8508 RepID=A0A8D0GB39_SPHPU